MMALMCTLHLYIFLMTLFVKPGKLIIFQLSENLFRPAICEANFNEDWNNWGLYSLAGTQEWTRDNYYVIGDTPCAGTSGYEGGPFANDDWLISPPMNFEIYSNEILRFIS